MDQNKDNEIEKESLSSIVKRTRVIPDLEKQLTKFVTHRAKVDSITKEVVIEDKDYIEFIEEFEKKCEQRFINLLKEVSIIGSVKTDRYSLPFQHEVSKILPGESYLNGAFEFHRVAGDFLLPLLQEKEYKIRFYIFIDIIDRSGVFQMQAVKYRFRYYCH